MVPVSMRTTKGTVAPVSVVVNAKSAGRDVGSASGCSSSPSVEPDAYSMRRAMKDAPNGPGRAGDPPYRRSLNR